MDSAFSSSLYKLLVGSRNRLRRLRRGGPTARTFAGARNGVLDKYGIKKENDRRVLLVSSNGAGLGHLTRLNAVSEHLGGEVLFYTMSSAYRKLRKPKGSIVYFPSYGDLGMNGSEWNDLVKPHFEAIVDAFIPDVVVFDGTFVYRPITEVCRERGVPLIWMQRGCWKPEIDARNTQRHNADKHCDAVIVPGDYGCNESVDTGGKIVPKYVGPITLSSVESLFSTFNARERLHLPQDLNLVLIQIGAGVINETKDLQSAAISAVKALGDGWAPVIVSNPLNAQENLETSYCVEAYPLADYYAAFNFGIFAAGYNTVQESIALKLPGVFVPNLNTKTDDQLRRAESIAKDGLGLIATDTESLESAIIEIARYSMRDTIALAMSKVPQADGAKDAARFIEDVGGSKLVISNNS